jgi:hypothetical protein
VRFCEVAKKFSGGLTYYRDLRRSRDYGKKNDELIEFTDDFPDVKLDLMNMFVADFIMNQEDRHAKNFGVLDNGCFSPLYDNGQSLHHSVPDQSLQFAQDDAARIKFLGIDPIDCISRYRNWLKTEPCIDFDVVLNNLSAIEKRYDGMLSLMRLNHNRKTVEGRVAKCREVLS